MKRIIEFYLYSFILKFNKRQSKYKVHRIFNKPNSSAVFLTLILLQGFEQIKCYLILNNQKITAIIAITAIFKPSFFGKEGGGVIPEIIIRFK